MKNIGYVLFNETVDSGLVKSQVLELLKNINNKNYIYIFNFIPFYKLFNLKKISNLNNELKKYNVKIIFLPITIPSRLFIFNISFKLFSYIYGFILLILSYVFKIQILHCRSYFATSLGVKCKKIRKNIKIVFDTRSLFIEENVVAGNINFGSYVYTKWKKHESHLLKKSDKVVIIDDSFVKYYTKSIKNKAKLKKIPIFANDNVVYYSKKARNLIRNKLDIDNKIVITYVGSFYSWNDPKLYAKYFKKLTKEKNNVFFLIITKDQKKIKKELTKEEISKGDYFITSCNHGSIYKYLSAGDYGIMVMEKNLDSDTRLGVKFIEYLATGLIPLLNKNVGAAYNITKNKNLGFDIDKENDLFLPSYDDRQANINFYNRNFSSKTIIDSYNQIYKNL